MDSGSIFHFSYHCGVADFRFISISHSHQPICTTLGVMIHTDKRMNPIHFESDSADDLIQINPEILDPNPGSDFDLGRDGAV